MTGLGLAHLWIPSLLGIVRKMILEATAYVHQRIEDHTIEKTDVGNDDALLVLKLLQSAAEAADCPLQYLQQPML